MQTNHVFMNDDCRKQLQSMASNNVDLILTSPPYEVARRLSTKSLKKVDPATGWYNGEFSLSGTAYINWLADLTLEMIRVSRGLVCIVIEGRTKNFEYSATPMLLAATMLRDYNIVGGNYNFPVYMRKPLIFRRNGIPGSGGTQDLRNDYEFVLRFSKTRKLDWVDNLACGTPPKYKRGGKFSHQTERGRLKDGKDYPSELKLANPGNVIDCNVGGGHLGSDYAHDNEAPFPLKLADFIIRTFCKPNGKVLDPFAGSGTVAHAAALSGRNSLSIDIRRSQFSLAQRRLRHECNAIVSSKKSSNEAVMIAKIKK